MKKINKLITRDWKDTLGNIKANILREKDIKREHQKQQENALRPYFNQAANHLGINQQQLLIEIQSLEPNLKEVLTDRRLKASTYAKLIKKYNPAYYKLFEDKIKSVVRDEKKYFQKKRQVTINALPIVQATIVQTTKNKRKLTKYEKKANKKEQLKLQVDTLRDNKVLTRPYPETISQWVTIEWHDVLFEDYLIKIKYGVNYSQGYPVPESRKSFRYLKKYIKNLHLPALSIFLVGREIREIKNVERVKEMVTLLRIKEQLIEDFQRGKMITALSMLERIKAISKHFLTQIAIAGNGEILCIEYLASQLVEGFKPIPAFEIIPIGNSINTEDTFIFVIKRQEKLFLVWESTVHGRATYIFKSDIDSYVDVVQAIYDYIGSPRKAKRMSLRKRDVDTSNLGYDGYVTHSAFDHWQQKLEASLNNP